METTAFVATQPAGKSTCRTIRIVLALLSVLLTHTAGAQTHDESGQIFMKEGTAVTQILHGDRVLSTTVYDPEEERRLIVQFDEPALSTYLAESAEAAGKTAANVQAATAAIEAQHSRFEADVAVLASDAPATVAGKRAASTQIYRRFSMAINGVAVAAPRWLADQFATLPYVTQVTEDRAFVVELVEAGTASAARERAHLTGDGTGIVIGILDSGIDYTHPDLGGGIGIDYKVIGGRDLVNNDSDPMDDFGHGTLVAGVAAANGAEFIGVATGAKLLAVKVLDQYGNGYRSRTISGLEFALNPDGNGATADAVDVINLSLGDSWGLPNGPVSQAVNNAAAMGVLCVAAVGNIGERHFVASPASASGALAVAALDPSGVVASYSARGPNRLSFGIKPDVAAPGSLIQSTGLGGGYEVASGTSMAAPYVSGVAAVLLQIHPDWSASFAANALRQHATDTGDERFAQGFGAVDPVGTGEAGWAVSPASIELGLVPTSPSSVNERLTIQNRSGEARDYTFRLVDAPAGVAFLVQPAIVSVADGANEVVTVRIDLDPTRIADTPVIRTESDLHVEPYVGFLEIESSDGSVRVPFTLVKAPALTINVDGRSSFSFVLHGPDYFPFRSETPECIAINHYGDCRTLLLPKGTIEALVQLDSGPSNPTYLVKEDIQLSVGRQVVTLSPSDATLHYQYRPRNGNGLPLDLALLQYHGEFENTDTGLRIRYGNFIKGSDPAFSFSPMLSAYRYRWSGLTTPGGDEFYLFKGEVTDFTKSHVFEPGPDDYRTANVRLSLETDLSDLWTNTFQGGDLFASASTVKSDTRFELPLVQKAYFMADPASDFFADHVTEYFTEIRAGGTGMSDAPVVMIMPSLEVNVDRELEIYFPMNRWTPVLSADGENISFGLGPKHWFAEFDNQPGLLRMSTATDVGVIHPAARSDDPNVYFPFFVNQLQDTEPIPELEYTLRNGVGEIIHQERFTNHWYLGEKDGLFHVVFQKLLPSSGSFELTTDDTYRVSNMVGRARVVASMNTDLADPNPPWMRSLNVLGDGEFTDLIGVDQPAIIRFEVGDHESKASVTLQYQTSTSETWHPVQLVYAEPYYFAELPADLPAGRLNVRMQATDESGNRLTYTADPAFLKSDQTLYPALVSLVQPPDTVADQPLSMVLEWRTISDAEEYELEVASDSTFKSPIVERTTSSTSVTLDDLAPGMTFHWRVRAKNSFGAGNWAARSFSTAPHLQAVALLEPGDDALTDRSTIEFVWEPVEGSDSYHIEVRKSDDALVVDDRAFVGTEYPLDPVVAGTNYQWRVRAHNAAGYGEWSPTRQFQVVLGLAPRPTLFSPEDGETSHPSITSFDWALDAGALGYRVQVATNNDFSAPIVLDTMVTAPPVVAGPLARATEYFWRVQAWNAVGTGFWSIPFHFEVGIGTGVQRTGTEIPRSYALHQNYPNPFNAATQIGFDLPEASHARISVFDGLGRAVRVLLNADLSAGRYEVPWSAVGHPSGLYFVRLETGGRVMVIKILLIR